MPAGWLDAGIGGGEGQQDGLGGRKGGKKGKGGGGGRARDLWAITMGDAQYHWGWGPQVGVPEREVVRSFDRAIALDSAFTPAYIHAIEMAFRYAPPHGKFERSPALSRRPVAGATPACLAPNPTAAHAAPATASRRRCRQP